MLEARELVQECVSQGDQSRRLQGVQRPGSRPRPSSPTRATASTSRASSTRSARRSGSSSTAAIRRACIWPRRPALNELLEILNAQQLAAVWGDDETIGWVYQYFNSGDERKQMRDESQAPRNSRELAVRNQFFTPRYVVQFLVDNTLARTWWQMRGGDTRLAESCEYLVLDNAGELERAKKDPRDLKILDPACGSGHFLLYAFDLLQTIYEEAWARRRVAALPRRPGTTLSEDYPSSTSSTARCPR